jgi:radical SAM superfamily enzyme YgiQ (UPF0313 family)
MNILLIYPQYPDTFWSFKHALKFISKKASVIPLGVITVAALLPDSWKKKVIDLNVTKLKDEDILWADYAMISAMSVQLASAKTVIERCRQLNTKIVAGGPLFTEEFDNFPDVDHLVLNEAEITLPQFLKDLEAGKPKRIYQTDLYADVSQTPVPDYSLLQLDKYASVGIQYTRGCPYDCEFCDITALFGRKVRTKSSEQVIAEMDRLYQAGWKGSVMFVDDNFIGNKKKLKNELLPAIIDWMKVHNYPFVFATEASINLADDKQLMRLMVKAGFIKVFVGIESPDESSLIECNKIPNNNRNMIQCVRNIQRSGIEVTGGFIVGFDSDPPNIFERQVDFIQRSGIVTAMVGLLNAPKLSKLYARMDREGRVTSSFSGDNTNFSMNFEPLMDKEELMKGYVNLIRDIYSNRSYYQRVVQFLKHYKLPVNRQKVTVNRIMAFFKSMLYIGIISDGRKYYWNLLFWSIYNRPKTFPMAVTFSIYGYHFRKVFNENHKGQFSITK